MAKLSHSGHTKIPADQIPWNDDWPSIEDAVNLWFFGLRNTNLRPNSDERQDAEKLRAWAMRLNLIDKRGEVPEWLFVVALNPDWLESKYLNILARNRFEFGGRDMWEAPRTSEPPMKESYRAMLAIANPRMAIPRSSLGNLADLGRARNFFETPVEDSRLRELLDEATVELRQEMTYSPDSESRAKAMVRIMRTFKRWLEIQLIWCEALKDCDPRRGIPDADLKLFIRFQCLREPYRQIAPKARPQDNPQSPQSKVRKAVKNVAGRLGIKLRKEVPGRPKKTMESRS